MRKSYSIHSIGSVKSTRSEPTDDRWNSERVSIVLDSEVPLASLRGIERYSHIEVVFVFDKVRPAEICWGARHLRGNPKAPKLGIFAQRAKGRPNRIGVSIVKLLSRRGRQLFVHGLDAINGTPVVDIKPVFREFLPKARTRQPVWITKMLREHW